jgi:hypothetical protein
MGFYYVSVFSIVLLGVVYAGLLLLFWAIARVTRGVRGRKALLGVVGAVFLVLPVAEELWIAWRFGQVCKEAGTFIYRKVQVEGFYDETGTGSLELVRSGTYRFIESRGDKGFTRLTLGDAQFMREALARYRQDNPGKDPSKQDVVRVKLDARTEALVFPQKGDSWRITLLDRPTARYHYKIPHSHTPVAYKIKMFEWLVEDAEAKTVLAREKAYAREANWFYVGLSRPTIFCPVFGNYGEKLTGGLYRLVLQPVALQ